jgi:SAM-dependent methyltransferase
VRLHAILVSVPQNLFVGHIARGYDAATAELYDPALLEQTCAFLAETAGGGRALEFGIGTGRVAIPLSERIEVCGLDISPDMLDVLHGKAGGESIATVVGDFATATVPGEFALVYIVYNSICNLLEQSEWVATFRNAARHLSAGGSFLVELWVPDLRRFPPGSAGALYEASPNLTLFDTYDIATQRGVTHRFFSDGAQVQKLEGPFRYAWPAELDLMAEIAGMDLAERCADWDRSPFTSDSPKHISVWKRRG